MQEIADKIEPGTIIEVREEGKPADASSDDKHAHDLPELIAGGALFIVGEFLSHSMPQISAVCFVIAYLILGREVLLTALKNMKTGHVMDENFLMSIATIGAFCVGQFGEAVGVMLFYRVGEAFEHRAVEKSRGQIMEAVDLRPETVLLDENGTVREVPAGSAVVGNIVEIRPGDRIPLDGVVVEGESRIDTSPITGEPVPVSVKVGSQLTSGCVNTSGLKDESRKGTFRVHGHKDSRFRRERRGQQATGRALHHEICTDLHPVRRCPGGCDSDHSVLNYRKLVPLDLHSSYLPRNQLPVRPCFKRSAGILLRDRRRFQERNPL